MYIYAALLMSVIACSVAGLGAYAQTSILLRISKAYSLSQALKDSATYMLNYNESSGKVLEDIVSWGSIGTNLHGSIDRHRQAQTFISNNTLDNIETLIDSTIASVHFQPLLNALKVEIAAEGLLTRMSERLLESDKHDLLFNELLAPDAIKNEQLRKVLYEVLYEVLPELDFAKEDAEKLFKAAQEVVNKRNKDVDRALVDKKTKNFYAYVVKEDNGNLLDEEGSLFENATNIITFGETTNGVKERIRDQTVGKTTEIITTSELPRARDQLDKIVMKILALTSDFRKVDIIKADGTTNTEAFVRVASGDKILVAEPDFVREEVTKAIAVVKRNYFYRSFFAKQKITPHLSLHYEGVERISFAKADIIARLMATDNPAEAFAVYVGHFNNKDVRQQLTNLYRAVEELRNKGNMVMQGIDEEFKTMLRVEYKVGNNSNKEREIPLAEIERQAAVLDLLDVTGDEFKETRFGDFISGRKGIPMVVRQFFVKPQGKLTQEQQEAWQKRLRELDEQREIEKQRRNLASSFEKADIIATLQAAEDPVVAFAAYKNSFNQYVRQQLANLYRVVEELRNKEKLRNKLGDEVVEDIDKEFKNVLTKKYKVGTTSNKAREIPLAEIERQAAVLDLLDVTRNKFNKAIFADFISGKKGIPKDVRQFFVKPQGKLTPAQQDVWLKQQDVWLKLRPYSFEKADIIATLQAAEDPVEAFAAYKNSFNLYVRQQLANLYRAVEELRNKEKLRNKLGDEVVEGIYKAFEDMLRVKYKVGNRERDIPLAEIERQAAVLDLLDVTGDKFKKASFKVFISGRKGIPMVVRQFFVKPQGELTPAQQEAWRRLQKLDEQRESNLASSFEKADIIATLQAAEDPVEAFAAYKNSFNLYVRQQLANLYRAVEELRNKEKLRNKLGDEVVEGIYKAFEAMMSVKYKVGTTSNKAREIPLAEIERQAAVLDLLDVTGDEFKETSFMGFISGENGIPKKVRQFFEHQGKEQQDAWQRLRELDEQRESNLASSFEKADIIATLQAAEDPVEAFAAYKNSFNQYVRQQLANLYRAVEELRQELGVKVMKSIDEKFNTMLRVKYKVGNRERDIPLAEIERQAAVLDLLDLPDLLDVTGDEFNHKIFYGFISGVQGIPKDVRQFFVKPQGKLTQEQQEAWQKRLRELDEQREIEKQRRNLASSFEKADIIATLQAAEDPVEAFAVYVDHFNNKDVRQQLANLYRAVKALRQELGVEVMEDIDKAFKAMLSVKYKLGNRERDIPLAEIERQAAVLDLLDVTGDKFKKASFKVFISGENGIPKKVRQFFEHQGELTQEQQDAWQRLRERDEQRKKKRLQGQR